MRLMLMSRCSLEKPSSEDRCFLTTSPSSSVTGRPPISMSFTMSALAMVLLPLPEKPVKNTVKPCLDRSGEVRRSWRTTSGKENQSGISSPSRRRRRSSVPEMSRTVEPSGTSSTGKYWARSWT